MSLCLSKSEAGDCLIHLQANWSVFLKYSKERPQHHSGSCTQSSSPWSFCLRLFPCEPPLLSHSLCLPLSLLISVGDQQDHHLLLGNDRCWLLIHAVPSTLSVSECRRKSILRVQFHPILHGCSQSPISFGFHKPHISCSPLSSTSPLRRQRRAQYW